MDRSSPRNLKISHRLRDLLKVNNNIIANDKKNVIDESSLTQQ